MHALPSASEAVTRSRPLCAKETVSTPFVCPRSTRTSSAGSSLLSTCLARAPRAYPALLLARQQRRHPPDAHQPVRRARRDVTPVRADVAEEHRVLAGAVVDGALRGAAAAVAEREEEELLLGEAVRRARRAAQRRDVPAVHEAVVGDREEQLVDRVVAQLADEAAVARGAPEEGVEGRGEALRERRDVPEEDPAVDAAAHEKRVGVVDHQVGDLAAVPTDGAAALERPRHAYSRQPLRRSHSLMRLSSAPVKRNRPVRSRAIP